MVLSVVPYTPTAATSPPVHNQNKLKTDCLSSSQGSILVQVWCSVCGKSRGAWCWHLYYAFKSQFFQTSPNLSYISHSSNAPTWYCNLCRIMLGFSLSLCPCHPVIFLSSFINAPSSPISSTVAVFHFLYFFLFLYPSQTCQPLYQLCPSSLCLLPSVIFQGSQEWNWALLPLLIMSVCVFVCQSAVWTVGDHRGIGWWAVWSGALFLRKASADDGLRVEKAEKNPPICVCLTGFIKGPLQ